MIIWLDAHLSPSLASWINTTFPTLKAYPLRDLGLRDASDKKIFEEARLKNAIIMTKDIDFLDIIQRLGSPPKIILLTCGNTTNSSLQKILTSNLVQALTILSGEDSVVEIR
jgi:predicted nuclease of predicted toxin-antitoxin system